MESNLFIVILVIVVVFRIINSIRRAAGGASGARGGRQVQQRVPAAMEEPAQPEKVNLWDFELGQAHSPETAGPQVFPEAGSHDDPWGIGTVTAHQSGGEVPPARQQAPALAEDPWSFDRDYRTERPSFVAPPDSFPGGQDSVRTATPDQEETLPEAATLTRPPRLQAGAPVLREVFTRRDPLLAAFIFHEVLEPPPSRRRKR